jgi:periplasmic protein TonB
LRVHRKAPVSSIPRWSTPAPTTAAERRAHPRRRLEQLAYIGFGPDTGGVLLDISQEGLRCQIVGAVVEGDRCRLRFVLPGRHSAIEANGHVVWSNPSGQGGGVRLVKMGPDVRQELEQWISDEMASGGFGMPSPAPIRTKSVGAPHLPRPSAPEVVVPAPAVNTPIMQSAVALPGDPCSSIESESGTGAEAPPSPQQAVTVEAALAVLRTLAAETPPSPPGEMPPSVEIPPDGVAEAPRSGHLMEKATAPAAAKTSVAPTPALRPAKRHPASPIVAEYQKPVIVSVLETQKPRFAKAALLAACVAVGFGALAFSEFNPTRLFSIVESPAESAARIIAPVIALPAPRAMAGVAPKATEAQPADAAMPVVASDAADLSHNTAQVARPAAGIASATPVHRPPQNPAAAAPVNRRQLALALRRPRATSPAPPASAAPEIPVTPPVPPASLMDMPVLESRLPELPQPVRVQAGGNYSPLQVLSQVEPVYSAFARQARLQGTVRVNATIGSDGVPGSLACLDGNTVLCQMALEAVAKWRYRPATSDGQPVEAQTLITFNFQLR